MAVGLPINAGSRILAAAIAAVAPICVIKQADEPVLNSAVMQNDNELVLNLPVAQAQYMFVCFLDYEGFTQGASDIKWQFTVPAGALLRYGGFWIGTGGGNVTGNSISAAATVNAAGTNGTGNARAAYMFGTLIVSTTTGALQLQWAQNTATASLATTVHAQSALALWRIS